MIGFPFTYIAFKGFSGAPKILKFIISAIFLFQLFFGTSAALIINESFYSYRVSQYSARILPIQNKKQFFLIPFEMKKDSSKEIIKINLKGTTYKNLRRKKNVCMERYSGLFGIDWFKIEPYRCKID